MWGRVGGRGTKSYDSEKDWSSINHSILSALPSLYTPQPKPGEKFLVIYYDARHTQTQRGKKNK
jgi:hypothetical protein